MTLSILNNKAILFTDVIRLSRGFISNVRAQ